ncbi:MAG: hypothetical protein HON37_09875 [Candidatus Marinimicrobia bacterium]|nr:hypothetical protein [Candidatus Neomarinimicrobiota bacterium]MBT4852365.1 hypothetical protein [Candidatus Neomarinimicrobiota bacterium]
MRISNIYSKIICILICCFIFAKSADKPTIGLALSGGGAKGAAHIGVLKVLEEAGIEVDYISGTSMGSFIGALYAIGYDSKRIEKIYRELDWEALLFDQKINRRSLSIQEKKYHSRYVREFPIKDWQIKLPRGLGYGHTLSQTLSQLTWPVNHVDDFSKIPIPFLCIATDLETGEAIVLDHGYLPDAIRASMSFPSVLTPVEIDGKLLSDGGIVRNFPVQDLRDKGVDIIIGVDIGAKLYDKNELQTVVNLMEQISRYFGEESNKEQREKCDILITPDIEGFTASSFFATDTLIERGERAAREILPQLKNLADSLKQFKQDVIKSIPQTKFSPVNVVSIEFRGLPKDKEYLIEGILNITPPQLLTPSELNTAIDRIYGSQYFERVTYILEPHTNGVNLILNVTEKKENVFKFGIQYNSDMKSAVLLNTTFRNLFNAQSRFSMDVRLGVNTFAELSYFSYSKILPGMGYGIDLLYDNFEVPVIDSSGSINALFDYKAYSIDLSLQSTFSNDYIFGGILEGLYSTGKVIYGNELSSSFNPKLINAIGFVKADTYDQTVFPHSGLKLYVEAKVISDKYTPRNGERHDSVSRFLLLYSQSIKLHNRLSIFYGVEAGIVSRIWLSSKKPYFKKNDVDLNEIPGDFLFWVGGPADYENNLISFTGLRFMEISTNEVTIYSAGIQLEPWDSKYISFKGNWGELSTINYNHENSSIYNNNKEIYGYGITIGMNTPIGPFQYILMKGSESDDFFSHISIGWWI